MEIKRVTTPIGKSLKSNLRKLDGKVGKVGWFEKSKYPDKYHTQVAFVAAQNEFGNPNQNIPARPFMRPTIHEQENTWKKIAYTQSKKVINEGQDIGVVMKAVGLKAAGDIRKTINKIYTPVLSERTIQARLNKKSHKGRLTKVQAQSITKPLIDTGIMLGTLMNTVEAE